MKKTKKFICGSELSKVDEIATNVVMVAISAIVVLIMFAPFFL